MAKIKTRTKGIYKELAEDGAVSYEVRFRAPGPPSEDGSPVWIQRQKTFDREAEAIEFKRQHHSKVKEGTYTPPVNLTVKQIAEKWLNARKPRWKAQTYLGAKTHVDKYIGPHLGHIKATSLRDVEIETAGAVWNKSIDFTTVNKIIFTSLGAAYKFAEKLGVKNNPVLTVERLRDQTTPEQLEARVLGEIVDLGTDHRNKSQEPSASSSPMKFIRWWSRKRSSKRHGLDSKRHC